MANGRTAHSRFKIPLTVHETCNTTTCNINKNSRLSKLINKAKVIIWDEAPMINKYSFDALDRTLRDILGKF